MINLSPTVFLCHSSPDKEKVRNIYKFLKEEGHSPWLDDESLVGGQNWKLEIEKAINNSDYFLACLSESSIDRRGFFHKEIRLALEVLDEMPEDSTYLIPIRLEPCHLPSRIRTNHWIDFYKPNFENKLLKALSIDGAPIAQITSKKRNSEDRFLKNRTNDDKSNLDNIHEIKIEVDYSRLIQLFKDEDWAKAAYETLDICVLSSGRHKKMYSNGWDYSPYVGLISGDYIPSLVLRKLNELWLKTRMKCILPVVRKSECESTFGSQIRYVNQRCQELGIEPLMEFGRWDDFESNNK